VLDGPQGSELQQLRVSTPSVESVIPRAVSLVAVVVGWKPDAERWLLSAFKHCKADFEAVVIDASGSEAIASWLATRAAERLRVMTVDPAAGFAAAANAAIEGAAGEVCVLFDTSIELTGDAITPLMAALDDAAVVVAGPFGLRAEAGMKEFKEASDRDADAIEGYCMAFRRADALAAGGMDPKFRFYRIADIDLSFRLRDHGGRAVVVNGLPLVRHEHRVWESTPEAERDRLSRRNLYRFLDRWRFRTDLLVGGSPTPQ
jgi:GT2 family glycosyltransferase